MPNPNPELVIKDFQVGIGVSPHFGFGDMRNLDIFTKPGVCRINNLLEKKSGTTVTGLIKWKAKNPRLSTEVFGLDAAGVVYTSTNSGVTWSVVAGNTTTSAHGNGLWIWKDYLIVARDSTLDVYGALSSSRSWTTAWKSIDTDTLFHPMLTAQDDMVYGGAGRYLYSIQELTTFDPSSAGTYTFTQQALDLPSEVRVKCLAELGEKLMAGTWMGSNIYDFKFANIYPWSRSTTDSFDDPIKMEDNGVNAMLTINNILYVMAGIEGVVSTCNGVQASPIAQIPISIADIEGGKYMEPMPGAVMSHKHRFTFGMSVGASNAISGMGIWSVVRAGKVNKLNFEHTISTGNDGTSNPLKIGALLSMTRDTFLASWQDNSTYGIDMVNNAARCTSYSAYLESPLFQVGSKDHKKTFKTIEFQLVKPLTTGQGIRIKYRKNLSDAFTTIGTWDFTAPGAVSSFNDKALIADAEFLQIRVELTTGSSSNTTPELRYLKLW